MRGLLLLLLQQLPLLLHVQFILGSITYSLYEDFRVANPNGRWTYADMGCGTSCTPTTSDSNLSVYSFTSQSACYHSSTSTRPPPSGCYIFRDNSTGYVYFDNLFAAPGVIFITPGYTSYYTVIAEIGIRETSTTNCNAQYGFINNAGQHVFAVAGTGYSCGSQGTYAASFSSFSSNLTVGANSKVYLYFKKNSPGGGITRVKLTLTENSPSGQPTSQPSNPTGQPSRQPSRQPSAQPSAQPSSRPSLRPTPRYNISVIAGTGTAGYSGDAGPGTSAALYWPGHASRLDYRYGHGGRHGRHPSPLRSRGASRLQERLPLLPGQGPGGGERHCHRGRGHGAAAQRRSLRGRRYRERAGCTGGGGDNGPQAGLGDGPGASVRAHRQR